MRSVNRRDIFPALGTVLLGGIATVSLAKPESLSTAQAKPEGHHPDARLIALCDEFVRLDQAYRDIVYSTEEDEQEAALQPIMDQQDPLIVIIRDTEAKTVEGVQARLRALTAWSEDIVKITSPYWSESLTAAIFRDLTNLRRTA